jgi:phosphoadenosine phosphosulfate reductase
MEPNAPHATSEPQEVLKAAFDRFELDRIAISFSGAEDVVLIDMATSILNKDHDALKVFCLDTGRLHPETYRYIETVRDQFGIDIELLMPKPEVVEKLVREKGLFSFYHDGHSECCAVRKIQPLQRKLMELDAWITGQRHDQNITRVELPTEQIDSAFSNKERLLTKFNPLANWTSEDVWTYIRENEIPYNPLHDQGMLSIGCEPCTRAIASHQHEREGRWWWEEADEKECGLHAQNIIPVKAIA